MRDVLQGKVLNVEGVVDVLTLKDNADSIDDFATALHLLARAEVISLRSTHHHDAESVVQGTPDARRLSSFRRAWCRVYCHDEYVCHFLAMLIRMYQKPYFTVGMLSGKRQTLPTFS